MHPYGVLASLVIDQHVDNLLYGAAQPHASTATKPSRRSRVIRSQRASRADTS